MTQRRKFVETNSNFSDFKYSASEMQCNKHPNSSSVGICAYCLKDRLVKLVCSECGEQRLSSSCSCSDNSSSYRNSCGAMEIGSVGRISMLIENEKIDLQQDNPLSKSKRKDKGSEEQVVFLRSSSSGCVEVKKSNGFWRIKRLFRKKRNKGCGKNGEFSDDESEILVSDVMGVSRSRSLCSYRGGKHNDLDEGRDYALPSAKISDVNSGILFDSDKQFGYESEPRKSGFRWAENGIDLKGGRRDCGPNHQMELDRVYSVPIFPVKESDFSTMDESAFIDLKLDSLSESQQDLSAARIGGASDHGIGYKVESFETGESLASLKRNGLFGNGGSCRITVNERGLRRGNRSHKISKWIFKYHSAAEEEK